MIRGTPVPSLLQPFGTPGAPSAASAGGVAAAAQPRALRSALAVMQECFHPILDYRTGGDLVPLIVCSQRTPSSDFTGFFTHCLRYSESVLCVATVRLLGADVAEMPLVGTSFKYRQQGLCRRLVRLVEEALYRLGVRRLVLPAVPDIEPAWVGCFGFARCSVEDKRELSSHGILVFPGTTLLLKHLNPSTFTKVAPGAPPPPHVLTRAAEAARRAPRPKADWAFCPLATAAEEAAAAAADASGVGALPEELQLEIERLMVERRAMVIAEASAAAAAAAAQEAKEELVVVTHTHSGRSIRATSTYLEGVQSLHLRRPAHGGRGEGGMEEEMKMTSPPPPALPAAPLPVVDLDLEAALENTSAAREAVAAAKDEVEVAVAAQALAKAARAMCDARTAAAVRAFRTARAQVALTRSLAECAVVSVPSRPWSGRHSPAGIATHVAAAPLE